MLSEGRSCPRAGALGSLTSPVVPERFAAAASRPLTSPVSIYGRWSC
jgi:hypothetical protein